MSEYDTRAPVYDAWASDRTEDVAHYVSLAREADGPISHTIAARHDGRRQDQHGVVHTLRYVVGRAPFDEESLEFVYITRRP